jgi:hypothetical protein
MLRITIELVPFGFDAQAEVLKTIYIVNDGTGTKTKGNYYMVRARPSKGKRLKHMADVKSWPRKRYGVLRLLWECLNEYYSE